MIYAYIFRCSAKSFPVADIGIISLNPLNLLSIASTNSWKSENTIKKSEKPSMKMNIDIFNLYFMNWLYAEGTLCFFSGTAKRNSKKSTLVDNEV